MLIDCRDGKIDMVITKSLTRFARNTVTLLATVRELKLLEVDVYFEKENIHTLSSDGELMLTLLASFAQEESRSASENQKWRIQKMFEEGRPNTGNMLGYRLVDGTLQIVPEEAEIVRMIFADFLSGIGGHAIMKKLNRMGILGKTGGIWRENTIYGILSNEKYTGNMLLQKTYRLDHIGKKKMTNHGELPMYYVENSHEPIIDPETFEQAKRRLAQQAERFCSAQQIPERILLAKTSEVLGREAWDREALLEQVTEIRVPGHNRLIYVFCDGHTQDVTWQNPSRRDSWTEEMKQPAREKSIENAKRMRKNGEKY